MEETLTHDAGMGIGNCRLRGGSFPLQGKKGLPNGVGVELQPSHLVGGIRVPLASFIRLTNELIELPTVIRGGQQRR